MPLSLTILGGAFLPERRGIVIGIWGGIAGLVVASGPLGGGAVTQGLSWYERAEGRGVVSGASSSGGFRERGVRQWAKLAERRIELEPGVTRGGWQVGAGASRASQWG